MRIELKKLIDAEDKAKPLSDDEIMRQLKAKGFAVARRTVAKYREKLDIPSSRKRRDWSRKEVVRFPRCFLLTGSSVGWTFLSDSESTKYPTRNRRNIRLGIDEISDSESTTGSPSYISMQN